jgi:hypothetical protein
LNFVDPTGLFLRDSDGFGEEEAIPIGLGVVFGAGLAYTLATTTFASGVGTSTAAVGSGAAGLAASGGASLLDSYGGNIFAAGGNAIAATLAPQGPLSVSTEAARQVRSSPGSSSSVPSAGRTLPNQWAPIQEQLSSVLAREGAALAAGWKAGYAADGSEVARSPRRKRQARRLHASWPAVPQRAVAGSVHPCPGPSLPFAGHDAKTLQQTGSCEEAKTLRHPIRSCRLANAFSFLQDDAALQTARR